VLLQDFLPSLTEHWQLLFGGIVISVALFLPRGATSLLPQILSLRQAKQPDSSPPGDSPPEQTDG